MRTLQIVNTSPVNRPRVEQYSIPLRTVQHRLIAHAGTWISEVASWAILTTAYLLTKFFAVELSSMIAVLGEVDKSQECQTVSGSRPEIQTEVTGRTH
jgi:hypothetical protein